MSKEVNHIIGSVTTETDFGTKCANQELENFQIGCDYYIPMTPLKPVLQRTRSACEQRQENRFSEEGIMFSNNVAQCSQAYSIPACYKTWNPVDIRNGFHNWEEYLASESRDCSKNHIPSEFPVSQQGHFGHLLALTNGAALKNFDSYRFEARSTASSPAKQGVPYELNLWSSSGWVPDMNLDGNSTPAHHMYDLNYPPTASMDAFWSQTIPSQIAPITPDHSKKGENGKVVQGLSLDGKINQDWDNEGDEIATTRVKTNLLDKELQQLPKDFLTTVESTHLQENHDSDKADLNKTPQQKPRRKHRPKVVIEGKRERNSKPATPMPEMCKENSIFKMKYVRKNKLNETSFNAGSKTEFVSKKSCKRALNFELEGEKREEREVLISESQAQNFSTRVESTSTVQIGEGLEIVLERTQVGLAYDLNRSINKVLEEYISAAEIQSTNPHTPNKSDPRQRDLTDNDLDDYGKGKCQIVLSDETLDKQGSNTTMIENQSAPTSINSLAEGKQARGLKRRNLHEYQPMFPQNWYNSSGFPGMHFPTIYKKKRTEKIYCSTISSPVQAANNLGNSIRGAAQYPNTCIVPNPTVYTSTGVASFINFHGKELSLECRLSAAQKGKMKRKRSKVPTRVRDFASLMGIIECGQNSGTLDPSPKSIEALVAETQATMTKKQRTRRLSFTTCTSTGVVKKRPSTVEEITELLVRLDINSKRTQASKHQKRELVPFNLQFENRNALVLYQRDGTIVPFISAFDPVKKRRPRPKVNLDEETNRVWKLLLENINNEGIDGTDDDKAKWWDDERRVFQGRADSFIARMHLVQGDRRFSPWKGSVLDSVVGVFLTQNVSDHLSSSAFMSLAARFPLYAEGSSIPSDKGASIVSKAAEVCISDLEDTINSQAEKSNCIAAEEVVNDDKSLERSSISLKSTVNNKTNFLEIFGKGLQIDNNKNSDREAFDDAFSSPNSAGSLKDSVDSLDAQPRPRSNSNYNIVPSFVELLQMSASSQGEFGKRTILSSYKENGLILMEGLKNCTSEHSGVTAESVSHIMVQNMSGNMLTGQAKTNIQLERGRSNVVNITTSTEHKEVKSSLKAINLSSSSKGKGRSGKKKESTVNWDSLRVQAQANGKRREKMANTMDSLDWEAVRCANVNEIADTIKERGMNNVLAERIKDFLNRLVKEHGSTDLEWLRDVPPDKAKEYLLSVRGLGLKSVECVRLLTLHHLAFPVDTNVGRIAVRLGWVPLQPLPELLQLHLLELYPVLESIQRYLWPRLCKLDQRTLYELHYQMITFGKVFCTKSKPNCNACPVRGECRHFASAFASARLALPGLEEKGIVSATEKESPFQNPVANVQQLQLPSPLCNEQIQAQYQSQCVPIIEVPSTPEPIVEVPASPEFEELPQIPDIEDTICEDPDEIPIIKLNIEAFTQNLQNYMYRNMELQEGDVSKALIALTPEAASLPTPKLKNVNRLRTEHSVYELPDSHPLLEGLDKREPDDPCSYLLAIWTPGETASSITRPEGRCSAQEFGELCGDTTCFSCNNVREANSQTVRGTILIPCRTATRGSFPLNGTYFQVNEVFADHDSSINPIDVPRAWIWNLPRRTVYFGTSIPSIFKGLSTESIQYCFWRGFVCVRGFDQKTRGPRPLMARLHFPASKLPRTQGKPSDKQK